MVIRTYSLSLLFYRTLILLPRPLLNYTLCLGNGEIDFEEFLDLMTNTEMFLEAFGKSLIDFNDCGQLH